MAPPNVLESLLMLAGKVSNERAPKVVRAMALYTLREIVSQHELDLALLIDQRMREWSVNLPEHERKDLRAVGFEFDEDLENVPQLEREFGSE